jgi:folate-binding protein YgfZ
LYRKKGIKLTVLDEHKRFLTAGGIFENPKMFIKVSGHDRVDFLHRITSQDIKNLISGTGEKGALLDPSGFILALFEIYNCGQFFLLVVDKNQGLACLENLQRLHFSEDLKLSDVSADFRFLSIQGKFLPKEELLKIFGKLPRRGEVIGVEEALVAFDSDFERNIPGYHFFIKTNNYSEVISQLSKTPTRTLSLDFWDLLRAESGHFTFDVDITEKNMILEAALDGFVARDKGCYPGQEVVERVFTYGTIAKKLMGLKLNSDKISLSEKRVKLLQNGEDAGYLTSVHKIPWSGKTIGFGIVRKPKYAPGEKLSIEGSTEMAEVMALPHAFEIKKKN